MKSVSRSALARAFVTLAGRYPLPQLIKALAVEVRQHDLSSQVDLLVNDISRELLAQTGHLEVEVSSARPLNDNARHQLEQTVRSVTGARTIRLNYNQDTALLGGVIARTPELEIDLSLQTKLAKLEA